MEQLPGFLQGLWDRALGVFDRVTDLELAKRELSVQRDVRLFKEAQAFEAEQRQSAFNSTTGQLVAGVDNSMLVIGALAVLGLVLVTR